MAFPQANRRGQKPYQSTAPVKPPQTINGAVGLAREAQNYGYTGVDLGNTPDTPQSGVNPQTGKRESFLNGRSPLAIAAEKAAATGTPANGKSAPFLNPVKDDSGKTVGGIDPQTGQNVTLQNGRFVGDGKPNVALLNQLKAQPQTPAGSTATAAPVRTQSDESWRDTFGHYPGTASSPITAPAPTIPAMPISHDVAMHDMQYGNEPVQQASATPPVAARNAAGYITDAGAQDAANRATAAQYPRGPVYGKVGPAAAVPVGTPLTQSTDAQGNTVIQHAGGGTVVIPKAQPQTPPVDGGTGISVNGVEQAKDGSGNFVNKAPVIPPGLGDLRQADEARVTQIQTDANNAARANAPGIGDLRQADEARVGSENATRADQASLATALTGAPPPDPRVPQLYTPGQDYSRDANVSQQMRQMQGAYDQIDPSLRTAAPKYPAPTAPAPVATQPTITAPAATASIPPAPPTIPKIVPPSAPVAAAPTTLPPPTAPKPPKDEDEDEDDA